MAALLALPLVVGVPARAGPGEANAKPSTATSPKEQARALFAKGQAAFEAGDYTGALALFEQAYATFRAPALFFNIAQCHRKMNAPAQVLQALERYIEADQNMAPSMRAEVDAQMAEARALIDEATRKEFEEEAAKARAAAAVPPPSTTTASTPPSGESEAPPIVDPIVLGAIAGGIAVAGATWIVVALALTPPPAPTPTSLGTVDLR